MAVVKEKVKIVIPGLTNRTNTNYYSSVAIYRANFDIQKFTKSTDGFLIDDFWDTKLFNVYSSKTVRRRLHGNGTISRLSTLFHVKIDNDSECPFVIGEYYWIYDEVVLLRHWRIEGDLYTLDCARAQFGTTNKMHKVNSYGDFKDGEEVYISNYRNDFNGLRVELYDLSNNLVDVGMIKETTYTDGIMVIDCDSYLSKLDVKIPEYKTATSENDTSEGEDIPFYVDKMLLSFFGYWREEFIGIESYDPNYGFYHKESDLFLYLDYDSFKMFINYQFSHFKSLLTRDSSISDYIRIIEFLTAKYLIFSGGKYRFLNLFNYQSTFEYNSYLESRIIKRDLTNIKYTTTRLFAPTKISFAFNNRTLNIISNDKASIGSGDITFKIGTDLLDEYEEEITGLLDVASLNYFRMLDFAICELKIQTPFLMNKNKYIVGETFIIDDIDSFFTFEESPNKLFNIGTVIKNEGNDISILISKRIFFDPFIPSFSIELAQFIYNTSTTYKIRLYIPSKEVLPFSVDDVTDLSLTHRPPYIDRQYFQVGDFIKICDVDVNTKSWTSINFQLAEILELPSGRESDKERFIVVEVPTSYRDYIINNNRLITNISYPDIGDENEFQSNFCKLNGSSLWV